MSDSATQRDYSAAPGDDAALVAALRRGDEAAFRSIVDQYHPSMVRLAMIYVGSRSVAEEVAQDAWVGVLRGLDTFEGRASLKTWIMRILANRARTRAVREGRSIPFSDLGDAQADSAGPTVAPDRFFPDDHAFAGSWAVAPQTWQRSPEAQILAAETLDRIRGAIAVLPASQQSVITLRDIDGWSSEEVCNVLMISESNQRVLLHRARAKVRHALEAYFAAPADEGETP
jgi:RNA polymerase sigma-70 factor (ECF subfamily)